MENARQSLLNELNKINVDSPEITDTAVRERLHQAIFDGFIEPKNDFELPTQYSMFSNEADEKIRIALVAFFSHPEVINAKLRLQTAKERLDAFQSEDTVWSEEMVLADYFGYSRLIDS